ncbi:uracil-DNA glycosylase [Accumulibacter sp.]|uniref:uracil-DNA glycosylase n=1 Tax=Accumulibacter sp. TaxID=2053492 RepID=UPI00260A90E0|nr:uracil-DNA glycosylase [Accumulibacter sp.]
MSEERRSAAGLPRAHLLREMGLTPQWRLREALAAGRQRLAESANPATATAGRRAVEEDLTGRPASLSMAASPTDRAARIARLGWDELRAAVADCRACGLCAERRQAVLGVGDAAADWLFIGEGPGAEEDARGEPFVGPAGKLLDAMLAAIDLRRGDDVYIANAVKCRPPNNRTPETAEMAACAPYLQRQIALLQPRLIVLLGRAAVHALLGDVGSLASLRGKPFAFSLPEGNGRPIPVVVTYHPAYLLRSLTDKAKAWEDLCRARALMREAKAAGKPAA